MLTATNHDGPAFHARCRTAQHNITEDFTSQPKTDTFTPDITKIKDTPDTMPKPLIEDMLQALLQMQRIYQMEKHQNMRLISFYTAND